MSTPLLDRLPRTRGRSRLLRAVLTGLAATGIAAALAVPAVAAPVGVPVSPSGHAVGWGNNDDEQATVPAPPVGQTYTAVAAGDAHSLALTSDGHVISWGSNDYGQLTGTPTDGGYIALAAGDYHSLALSADGHITAWGSNNYGQLNNTPTGGGYTAIAAGIYHSLAIDASTAPTLTGAPPAATAGQPYSHTFTLTGFPTPTVAVTTGELPAGLTLSEKGALSGTATTAGKYTFTVTATNDIDPAATLEVTVTVAEATTTTPSTGSLGILGTIFGS
ncbi:Ig domain-containing protein [Rhodococcus sp. ARC_M6]|uniref:Ig domain-containing protein n=1 Tax=Rhodococcus sp. ARC_M6 TaxID=2928852 RepID=UPI001FB561B0|nr:Ig domain-containing protein [Rhodococcus sp. ARC_M6]MCJ0901939.1 putative Ig domain-containing protein [Rhodococcus sp. ARC_M6]